MQDPYVICFDIDDHERDSTRYAFSASELGGIPMVGDFIVDHSVRPGRDPGKPSSRMVLEVKARYILPAMSADGFARVALMVRVRSGDDDKEAQIFTEL